MQYNPEDVSEPGKLQKLFEVSKLVMKAKHESVEETIEEFEKETKKSQKKGLLSLFFNQFSNV